MKTRLPQASLIAAIGLCLSLPNAAAGEFDRSAIPWYVGGGAGLQNRATARDEAGETTFDTGYAMNATLGRRFDALRIEGEYSYFRNNDKTTNPAGPFIGKEPSSGYVDIQGWFINAYYDFRIDGSRFTPYVGAGIGRTKAKIHGLTTPTLASFGVVVYGQSEPETTYQLRLGASYALSRQTDLLFGYRYVRGNAMTFRLNDGSMIHPNGIELHNLELGLRVLF